MICADRTQSRLRFCEIGNIQYVPDDGDAVGKNVGDAEGSGVGFPKAYVGF